VDMFRLSLLERLYHHPRWQSGSPWLVHLHRNYRSHPAILELLSATRYEGSLLACANLELVRKFENHSILPKKGFPIAFVGVRGQQQMDLSNENQHCLSRPDVSHSYHNPEEAIVVLTFVRRLLAGSSEEDEPVRANDIGIVCSFRRQVQKIRGLLRSEGFGSVRVGTAEDYQGQQERILIISTTLSDPSQAATLHELDASTEPANAGSNLSTASLVRHKVAETLQACIQARVQKDEVQNGGPGPLEQRQTANLVGNVRRFTVALSRAQCLLIVVGCPEVLETTPHWRRFLLYVAAHGGLSGETPSQALLAPAGSIATAPDEELSAPRSQPMGYPGPPEGAPPSPPGMGASAGPSPPGLSEKQLELVRAGSQVQRLQAAAEDKARVMQTYATEVALLSADLRRCVAEKEEVIAHAMEIERQRQEEADDLLCVVCTVGRRAVAFLPCGHVLACKMCASRFWQQPDPRCPNCRGGIENILNVYL